MSLKHSVVTGIRAIGSSGVAIVIIQFGQLILLARLLQPDEFGLMAMAMVAVAFATLVADVGIGGAFIQRQHVAPHHFSALYWLNTFASVTIFFMLFFAAPLIADLYDEPRLVSVVRWIDIIFLISPIGQMYRALLEKEMQFGLLAKLELVGAATNAVTSLVFAIAGYGVLALVWGYLIAQALMALVLYFSGRKLTRLSGWPTFRGVKSYLIFGAYSAGQKVNNFFSSNVDFIVIGMMLGAQALGYYSLAYKLANLPSSHVNAILARVFFPALARLQAELNRMKSSYLAMQEYSTTINAPLLMGLFVLSPLLVPYLLGDSWISVIKVVQILCVVGLTRSIAGTVGPLILARGRTDLGFKWSIFVVVLQVPCIYLGAYLGGVTGVALAFALVQIPILIMNYTILIRSLLGPCLKDYLVSVGPSLGIGLVVAGIMWIVADFSVNQLSPRGTLLIEIVIGAAVYGALLWKFKRSFLDEVIAMLRHRTSKQSSAE